MRPAARIAAASGGIGGHNRVNLPCWGGDRPVLRDRSLAKRYSPTIDPIAEMRGEILDRNTSGSGRVAALPMITRSCRNLSRVLDRRSRT